MSDRPDDGGSKHLWNAGKLLPDYTAQQPRRQQSSYHTSFHDPVPSDTSVIPPQNFVCPPCSLYWLKEIKKYKDEAGNFVKTGQMAQKLKATHTQSMAIAYAYFFTINLSVWGDLNPRQ
jgi:hypothetical protein